MGPIGLRAGRSARCWISSILAALVFGCSASPGEVPGGGGTEQGTDTGSIGLRLFIGDGVEVAKAEYVVTGNDIEPRRGSIDLDDPASKAQVLVGALPAGDGYTIVVTALSTDGSAECSGSAKFEVIAGATTSVGVTVNCRPGDGSGEVVVDATLNTCPKLDVYTLAPVEVAVGGSIFIEITASDADGDDLHYSFSASTGSFDSVFGPKATYVCPRAGNFDVTMRVSDGECEDEAVASVRCVVSPFCGNGVLDPREPCDDGNRVGGDGCAADCSKVEVCGDELIDEGEFCDDGNVADGDGCRSDCSGCGDANVDQAFGEECDDGNDIGEDACTNACTLPRCGDAVCSTAESCLSCGEDCGACSPEQVRTIFEDPGELPELKAELAFQTTGTSFDFSSENIKRRFADWSADRSEIPNRPDLLDALESAWRWTTDPDRFDNLDQPTTALSPTGNGGATEANDSAEPTYFVSLEHAWQLYTWWVAHNLALELRRELPWSVSEASSDQSPTPAALFDSTELFHRLPDDTVQLGHAPEFGYLSAPYASYLGTAILGTPRYTYRFLVQNQLLKPTRRETIAALLGWIGERFIPFSGFATRASALDHWGHRYNPTVEMLIEGTVRASDGRFGHFAFGSHGTAQFVKDVLRAVNIPVRVPYLCFESELWFPTDGIYLSDARAPYDTTFQASGCSAEALFVDVPQWQSLFGTSGMNGFDFATCNAVPTPLAFSLRPEALSSCE